MSGMMFAARGLAVSFSVFVLVYCVLSVAVSFGWRVLWLRRQRFSVRRVADLLFALRMLPLLVAAAITAAFAVPSFLLLEPRSINEPLSPIPMALGLCGVVLGVVGVLNAGVALRRASRTISAWMRAAQPIESSAPVPMLRISSDAANLVVPPMTAVGIAHPKVLLSGAAESMLTADELQAALNHELAHVRRRDNLKKLLLRFVAFPAMSGMEAAWLEATEMASDDAAVSNAGQALDLASALLKLSRLAPVEPPLDLTAALVHSPAAIMNARVERLIAWNSDRLASHRFSPGYGLAAAVSTVAVFALTYSHLLARVHTATEWLVR